MADIKLCNIKNIDEFFHAISKCKGQVTLVGKDITLNLKSELTKYFAVSKLFADGTDAINEIEIMCSDPNDVNMLMRFMINGEVHD